MESSRMQVQVKWGRKPESVREKSFQNQKRGNLSHFGFVPTVLYCLSSVVDLEDPSLGGEGSGRVVILHNRGEKRQVWVSDVRIRSRLHFSLHFIAIGPNACDSGDNAFDVSESARTKLISSTLERQRRMRV